MKSLLAALAALALSVSLLAACTDGEATFGLPVERIAPLLGVTNVRVVDKGPLMVRSFGNKKRYGVVQLGSPRQPYAGEPELLVALPDGYLLNLAQPSAVALLRERGGNGFVLNSTWTWFDGINLYEPWPPETEQLLIPPYEFYILDSALIGFRVATARDAASPGDGAPRIGTRADKLVMLPFSASDYLLLFGQPERVRETFQE